MSCLDIISLSKCNDAAQCLRRAWILRATTRDEAEALKPASGIRPRSSKAAIQRRALSQLLTTATRTAASGATALCRMSTSS
mmetsp:Transcript_41483/g.90494  ORF Transcript_41483/g.90494 Transcript_41483/m.90494 type:complete len:82 (+) Transcript_41483:247-492(+)